jgi:hypothetical protein
VSTVKENPVPAGLRDGSDNEQGLEALLVTGSVVVSTNVEMCMKFEPIRKQARARTYWRWSTSSPPEGSESRDCSRNSCGSPTS